LQELVRRAFEARPARFHGAAPVLGWLLLLGLALGGCRGGGKHLAALEEGDRLVATDPSAAIAPFQSAIALGAVAQGHAGLGRAYEELGDVSRAREHLEAARAAAPENLSLRLALGRVYLKAGREADARRELEHVTSADASELPAALLLAALARDPKRAERGEQALAAWERARGADPVFLEVLVARRVLAERRSARLAEGGTLGAPLKSPALAGELASLYAEQGRFGAARELLTAVLREPEPPPSARIALLRVELGLNNLSGAERALASIPASEHTRADVVPFVAELQRRLGKPTRAANLLAEALSRPLSEAERGRLELARVTALVEAQDTEAALAASEARLRRAPSEHALRLLRATLLVPKQPDAAVAELELVIKGDPQQISAHELLLSLALSKGDFEAAKAAAERYAQQHPKLSKPRVWQALVLERAGDGGGASAQIERAVELDANSPDVIELWLRSRSKGATPLARLAALEGYAEQHKAPNAFIRLAQLHVDSGKAADAERVLTRGAALAPADASAARALALFLLKQHGAPRAIPALSGWLALAPESVEALEATAHAELAARRFEQARQTFERILAVNPVSVPALNNLAMLWVGPLNDPARAVEFAERAYREAPSVPAVKDTLGWSLFRRGRAQDQERALTLLSAADDGLRSPESAYHLGALQLGMGKRAEAEQSLKRALASKAPFEGAAEARELLTKLEQ
jgi:tetratricopeptide (TPR) repeat protein